MTSNLKFLPRVRQPRVTSSFVLFQFRKCVRNVAVSLLRDFYVIGGHGTLSSFGHGVFLSDLMFLRIGDNKCNHYVRIASAVTVKLRYHRPDFYAIIATGGNSNEVD